MPSGIKCIGVSSAVEMRDAVLSNLENATVIIKAAAVADYRPAKRSGSKIKKKAGKLTIDLERNPDIIEEVGRRKDDRILVGFAMETENLVENARAKLRAKNMDLIVANDLSRPDAGFAVDTNLVIIIDRQGIVEELPLLDKSEIANRILDRVKKGKELQVISERNIREFRQALVYSRNYLESCREDGLEPFAPSDPKKKELQYKARRKNIYGLEEIREKTEDCRRCELCEGRNTIVFGEGNPRASLIFIGEGPGADEDAQGRPFVGRAGQLLNKMILAMGLKREDVYIANIVKCRPPGNRAPKPQEAEACSPFLIEQIKTIKPDVICALGTVAAQFLMKTGNPVSVLRGRFHDYEGIKLMPTYHPAYLLRNPNAKKLVWEDLQMIMKVI